VPPVSTAIPITMAVRAKKPARSNSTLDSRSARQYVLGEFKHTASEFELDVILGRLPVKPDLIVPARVVDGESSRACRGV